MAVWKQKHYQPEQLVEKIMQYRTAGGRGDPFFDREMRSLLVSMVEFDQALPEEEKLRIADTALYQLRQNTELTKDILLREVCILEHQFLNQPKTPYVLASALSASTHSLFPRKVVGDTTITFTFGLPPRFRREREQFDVRSKSLSLPSPPIGYQAVRVRVLARSTAEASQLALDRLDLLRAIWNLHLHYGRVRVTYGRRNQPVNQIVLGPLHSLHHPSGELATDTFWYEPGARFLPPSLDLSDKRDKLFEFEMKIRNRLNKLNYKATMEQALRRYVRALDESDWEKSFARLWSLLELLTHTEQAKYDVTIQRTCFLFEDRGYTKQILEHLREYRNRYTHDDESTNEIELLVYKLKNIIEQLLVRQVYNILKFDSIEEWGEFLTMPADPNDLGNRLTSLNDNIKRLNKSVAITQKALQFRSANVE